MINFLDSQTPHLFFMGIRNAESPQRSNYKDLWKNHKWGKRPWIASLPIREWSDEDVWLYLLWKQLPLNPKYKKGYARVGCAIACPFYSKTTWVLDRYWYPYMYQRWQQILKDDFITNSKWLRMNCTLKEYMFHWNGGMVRSTANAEVIQEFAQHANLSFEAAKKFFGNLCSQCNKKIKTQEDIAMNLKLLGRTTSKLFCKKHLKEHFELTSTDWQNYVSSFKQQECELF